MMQMNGASERFQFHIYPFDFQENSGGPPVKRAVEAARHMLAKIGDISSYIDQIERKCSARGNEYPVRLNIPCISQSVLQLLATVLGQLKALGVNCSALQWELAVTITSVEARRFLSGEWLELAIADLIWSKFGLACLKNLKVKSADGKRILAEADLLVLDGEATDTFQRESNFKLSVWEFNRDIYRSHLAKDGITEQQREIFNSQLDSLKQKIDGEFANRSRILDDMVRRRLMGRCALIECKTGSFGEELESNLSHKAGLLGVPWGNVAVFHPSRQALPRNSTFRLFNSGDRLLAWLEDIGVSRRKDRAPQQKAVTYVILPRPQRGVEAARAEGTDTEGAAAPAADGYDRADVVSSLKSILATVTELHGKLLDVLVELEEVVEQLEGD